MWGGRTQGNLTSKYIKANVCKNDCTCASKQTVNLSYLCKWKRQKWLLLLLNGTQYARQKKNGTHAVRKAKTGRFAVRKGEGVSPSLNNLKQPV